MDKRKREYQRVYAEVDLDAILDNVRKMQQNLTAGTKIIAVIKADGYGHGSVPVANCLEPLEYIYAFAVATAEEAIILRKSGITKPLIVLGYTFPYCYGKMAEFEISPTLFREDMADALSEAAVITGKNIKVHIKVETGMNRIGILPDESGIRFIKMVQNTKGLEIEGIFTHFARADEADKAPARIQMDIFKFFLEKIKQELGLDIPVKHCSNSAGIIDLPEANMDAVRAGISLYGLYPSADVKKENVLLRPALSLHSHIVYLKTLLPGQSVSYGGTYTTSKTVRVATIPVGYGDGYPRSLSNRGYVLIRGKRAPILGRICMDQFMVDVTGIHDAALGDEVILLGQDREASITAEEISRISGRFHYELVCDLGKRIPRVYIKDQKVIGTKDYYHDFR